jgi:hypothetical protein
VQLGGGLDDFASRANISSCEDVTLATDDEPGHDDADGAVVDRAHEVRVGRCRGRQDDVVRVRLSLRRSDVAQLDGERTAAVDVIDVDPCHDGGEAELLADPLDGDVFDPARVESPDAQQLADPTDGQVRELSR